MIITAGPSTTTAELLRLDARIDLVLAELRVGMSSDSCPHDFDCECLCTLCGEAR